MMHLMQIGLAMFNAEMRNRRFPANFRGADGKPLLSWRVQLLPFIEGGEIYKEFNLDEPWDSEHNKKLIPKIPAVFRGDPKAGLPEGHTIVMAFAGEGTPFGGEKGITVPQIKDGLSNTIALVAVGPDKAVPWTKPQDLPFDLGQPDRGVGPDVRPRIQRRHVRRRGVSAAQGHSPGYAQGARHPRRRRAGRYGRRSRGNAGIAPNECAKCFWRAPGVSPGMAVTRSPCQSPG